MHKMKVRALDGGGRFCEAEVEITVEDVNDNAPQFTSDPYTFTVFENTEINTPVARLYASDLDTGKISCIQYNDIFMSVLYVLVSVFPKIFCNFATVWPVDVVVHQRGSTSTQFAPISICMDSSYLPFVLYSLSSNRHIL